MSEQFEPTTKSHEHCWHLVQGPLWQVVPDGCVVQKCCGCEKRRTVHADHVGAAE